MPTTPKLNLPYPDLDDTADVPRDISALAYAVDPLGMVPIGAMMIWPKDVAPTGWLLCKGQADASVLASLYPELAAVLGTTVVAGVGTVVKMPDLAGRIPLGSGAAANPAVQGGTNHPILTKGGEEKHVLLPAETAIRDHKHKGTSDGNSPSIDHLHGGSTAGANSRHTHSLPGVPAHTGGAGWAQVGASIGGGTTRGVPSSFGASGMYEVGGTGEDGPDHSHNFTTAGADRSLSHSHTFTSNNPDASSYGATANGGEHNTMPPFLTVNYIIRHGH
jgi:microcystin-dependent protein